MAKRCRIEPGIGKGKAPMAEEWISISEAADASGYTADYLRTLIRQGTIIGRKVVTVWLVDRKSLESFLKQRAKQGEKRGRRPLT